MSDIVRVQVTKQGGAHKPGQIVYMEKQVADRFVAENLGKVIDKPSGTTNKVTHINLETK